MKNLSTLPIRTAQTHTTHRLRAMAWRAGAVAACTLLASNVSWAQAVVLMQGPQAQVTTADVRQSNGIVHVIDSVLMPK